MADQGAAEFPFIYSFDGGPSADGAALLVEATGFEGSVTRFAIPVDNVKHFIAFLLVWIGTISARQEEDDETGSRHAGHAAHPRNLNRHWRTKWHRRVYWNFCRSRRPRLFLAYLGIWANRPNSADRRHPIHHVTFVVPLSTGRANLVGRSIRISPSCARRNILSWARLPRQRM